MERNKFRNVAIAVFIALAAILAYQVYWLVGQYRVKRVQLKRDIAEAMRRADLQEMDKRVGLFHSSHGKDESREVSLSWNYQTYKDYNNRDSASVEKMSYIDQPVTNKNSGLKNYLKTNDGVNKLGMAMQQALHTGLDGVIDINVDYYDKCLTHELERLGIDSHHLLLYLYHHDKATNKTTSVDTLKIIGDKALFANHKDDYEIYNLEIDYVINTYYQLILPSTRWVVVKQMGGIIVASFLLMVLLGFVFLWLILIIKRQRKIDKMKTDFTNNMTHQLKTPIAIAYAANDALLNYGLDADEEKRKEYLKASLEQLRKLTELVEQILSFKSKYYNE